MGAKSTEEWRPGMFPEIVVAGNELGGGDQVGAALAHILNLCPRAKTVSISRCGLDVTALQKLADDFNDHYAVTEIDMLHNKFGKGTEPGEAIGGLISKCPATRKFFIYRCGLNGETLEALGSSLETIADCEAVDMSNDELFQKSNLFKGEAAGRGIAE